MPATRYCGRYIPIDNPIAKLVCLTSFWVPLAGGEILYSGWHPLSLTAWLAVGWLAIMSTVIGYLAWFKGLEQVDGSAAASTLFVQPLLGTVLAIRSEEHTSELQSHLNLVCRLLLEKKKKTQE